MLITILYFLYYVFNDWTAVLIISLLNYTFTPSAALKVFIPGFGLGFTFIKFFFKFLIFVSNHSFFVL